VELCYYGAVLDLLIDDEHGLGGLMTAIEASRRPWCFLHDRMDGTAMATAFSYTCTMRNSGIEHFLH